MRNKFAETLLLQAKKNRHIVLLTGDLGYSVFEDFQSELPAQFINAGIAEQNMTGVAAGMAMEGKIPIIYSIVPFSTMRNFEQIRNDICYQNLNVKIVGVGAGFSYGPYGHTHHGLEDIGILRTIPNLVILCPGDPVEAELATKAALNHHGPVYIRIGKKGEPNIHHSTPSWSIGQGLVVNEGQDITIIATSTMLERGSEVADNLAKKSISIRLISMLSLKPIDKRIILESVHQTKAIITLEEHSIIGGLGSAVAEILAENNVSIPFKRIGVPDRFSSQIGLQEYMRKANGLATDQIETTIKKLIKK